MPIDIKFGDLAKLFKGWGRSSVKSTGIIDAGSTNTSFKVKDEVYIENQFKNYYLQMITGDLVSNYFKITANTADTLTVEPDRGVAPAEDDIFCIVENPVTTTNSQVKRDSTESPLDSGNSYTGSAFMVSEWGAITGTCFSDQDGEILVQQSDDGINWDAEQDYLYPADEKLGFQTDIVAPYARVIFTNTSGVNQTVLRLNVYTRVVSGV